MSPSERRTAGLNRVPFEAIVEIAAADGNGFEAESVDLSATGMHLKTAFLPRVGAPLQFRFDGSPGADGGAAPVVATGQVVWAQDGSDGCEFGVRFVDVPPGGAAAIQQIVDMLSDEAIGPQAAPAGPKTLAGVQLPSLRRGAAVRMHIEGVTAPMRATMREDSGKGATLGSELKMLRLGALVELEDKETSNRRSARVEDVSCEVDAGSRIPQLVVKLRYDVETPEGAFVATGKAPTPAQVEAAARELRGATMPPPPSHMTSASSMSSNSSNSSNSSSANGPSSVVHTNAKGASEMAATLGVQAHLDPLRSEERAQERLQERVDGPQSRSALPVAGADGSGRFEAVTEGMKDGARKVGSVMRDAMMNVGSAASVLGTRAKNTALLLARRGRGDGPGGDDDTQRRITSPAPTAASGRPRALRVQGTSRDSMNEQGEEMENAMQEIDVKKVARRKQLGIALGVGLALVLAFFAFHKSHKASPSVATAPAPELAPAPPPPALPAPPPIDTALSIAAPPPAPLAGDPTGMDDKGNPNPFGNTTVKKGTRMTLQLDGPVGELRGTITPNGFVVAVPSRMSKEAAGPLSAKDPRIASAKVVNHPGIGAELTIAFKDAPPAYVVKAKGNSIEIILAKDKPVAKKNKGGKPVPVAKPAGKKK